MKAKELTKTIVQLLETIDEPLETKEILAKLTNKIHGITRTKTLYRLMVLRGDGAINGKSVGSGKGVWIWWTKKQN